MTEQNSQPDPAEAQNFQAPQGASQEFENFLAGAGVSAEDFEQQAAAPEAGEGTGLSPEAAEAAAEAQGAFAGTVGAVAVAEATGREHVGYHDHLQAGRELAGGFANRAKGFMNTLARRSVERRAGDLDRHVEAARQADANGEDVTVHSFTVNEIVHQTGDSRLHDWAARLGLVEKPKESRAAVASDYLKQMPRAEVGAVSSMDAAKAAREAGDSEAADKIIERFGDRLDHNERTGHNSPELTAKAREVIAREAEAQARDITPASPGDTPAPAEDDSDRGPLNRDKRKSSEPRNLDKVKIEGTGSDASGSGDTLAHTPDSLLDQARQAAKNGDPALKGIGLDQVRAREFIALGNLMATRMSNDSLKRIMAMGDTSPDAFNHLVEELDEQASATAKEARKNSDDEALEAKAADAARMAAELRANRKDLIEISQDGTNQLKSLANRAIMVRDIQAKAANDEVARRRAANQAAIARHEQASDRRNRPQGNGRQGRGFTPGGAAGGVMTQAQHAFGKVTKRIPGVRGRDQDSGAA